MDGLAYYRLTQVPTKAPEQKKASDSVEEVDLSCSVAYECSSCRKETIIGANSNIQCRYCDWRILEKPRTSVTLKTV
jgi:DNA-directed RNA polymerase subunit RPC12/RpoP